MHSPLADDAEHGAGRALMGSVLTEDEIRVLERDDRYAVVRYGPDFVVTAWSRGACLLYGWTAEEALGRFTGEPVNLSATADVQEKVDGYRRRVLETGDVRHTGTWYAKGGRTVLINVRVVAVDHGFVAVATGRQVDTTEIQPKTARVTPAIDKGSDPRRSLADLPEDDSPGPMPEDDLPGRYQIDADFVVTAWDGGAERHLGWTAADTIGRLEFHFMPTPVVGQAQRIATLRRHGSSKFETKAGEVVTAAAAAAAIRDEVGRVVGYSCAICPQVAGKPDQRRGTVAAATNGAESSGRPGPLTLERL